MAPVRVWVILLQADPRRLREFLAPHDFTEFEL